MDYRFYGPPASVSNAIGSEEHLGPVTLDGISYTNVRTDEPFTVPDDCKETGPELSAAILGVWYEPTAHKAIVPEQYQVPHASEQKPTETKE